MNISRLTVIFLFVFAMLMPVEDVFGQSADKKTKKELKEFMKNPNAYRKMIRGYKDDIEAQEVELNEIKEDYYKVDYLRTVYYDSIQELNAQIAGMTPAPAPTTTFTDNSATASTNNSGTDYRVQIGAYKYFDFTHLLSLGEPIGYENIDGIIYYFLGSWESPYAAYEFAEAMRKLDINDAFVSKYVNGNRVYYDHIMESGGTVYNE